MEWNDISFYIATAAIKRSKNGYISLNDLDDVLEHVEKIKNGVEADLRNFNNKPLERQIQTIGV